MDKAKEGQDQQRRAWGRAKINTHKNEDESGELEKQKHKNVANKKR